MKKTIRTVAIAAFLVAGLVNGSAYAQEAAPAVGAEVPDIQPMADLIAAAQAACAVDVTAQACLDAIVLLLASYPGNAEALAAATALVGEDVIAGLADEIAAQQLLLGTEPGDVGGGEPAAVPAFGGGEGSGVTPPPPTQTSPS